MASKLIQAVKQKDTRNKILFTIFILVLYRIGTCVPVPGIPFHDIADQLSNVAGGAVAMLDLFAGGALGQMSFLSLGIMPYITASIIMQLMALVIPKVAKWREEGSEGRRQIIKWTRFLTLGLGLINAIGYDLMFQAQFGIRYPGAVPSLLSNIIVIFTLLVGVITITWMAELINQHGITSGGAGSGMSLIVLVNVVSSVPSAVVQSIQTAGEGASGIALTIAAILFIVAVLPIIVYVERAQRRVPIKSSKQGADSRYARVAETSYIPVPIDIAGLYALIFASSFTMMPVYAAAIFTDVGWLQTLSNLLTSGPVAWAATFVLVIAFSFFMAGVNFNSENVAENLRKAGSYVPGVRPGPATVKYFEYIVNHVTVFGSVFIAILAVASAALFYFTNNQVLQAFGGTSILIAISGSLQLMGSIEQSVRANDPEAVLKRLGR